jgi:hypothetical protein
MYSTSTPNNGLMSDEGQFEGHNAVYAQQIPWNGAYVVEISGENWEQLKKIAQDGGYTKLVLKINGMHDGMVLDVSADVKVGKNTFADFESQEKLVVIVASAPHDIGAQKGVNFSLWFEK